MKIIKEAHLYVEKYSRSRQELLLDFIQESEFLYLYQRGDYIGNMSLPENTHTPTMLLIHGCSPQRDCHEGMIITIRMDKLLRFYSEYNAYAEGRDNNQPALVFWEINDGTLFSRLIDSDDTIISNHIPAEFFFHSNPQSSWNGAPCALNNLDYNFEVRIWNVGQGNTNSIFDKRNLTLFDFGASIYYSKKDLSKIIQEHDDIIQKAETISLIISHWDCDHFNLLCAADDSFFNKLCCVFHPPVAVTLTAKQVAARIDKNCHYRVIVPPQKRNNAQRCGIQAVFASKRYTLFAGETNKNKNLSGLLLVVYNDTGSVIFTADHSNYQVWHIAYNIVNNNRPVHIIVPHHGGNCGIYPVQTNISSSIAVISSGGNTYGHPLPRVINEYRIANYKVLRTDQCLQDITINL